MNDQLLVLAIGIPLIIVVMLIIRIIVGKKPEGEIGWQLQY